MAALQDGLPAFLRPEAVTLGLRLKADDRRGSAGSGASDGAGQGHIHPHQSLRRDEVPHRA